MVVMTFEFFQGPVTTNDPMQEFCAEFKTNGISELNCVCIDPDTIQPSDFKLEAHQIIWQYWQTLRGKEKIATYNTIDPIAFNKAIGFVLLLEPNTDNTDFKYRVYGSVIADTLGVEMTGKWVSEFKGAQKYLSLAQYPKPLIHRCPIYSEHITHANEYQTVKWNRLILPMQNTQGEQNRILVGNVPFTRHNH
jgi:hypothetical protein